MQNPNNIQNLLLLFRIGESVILILIVLKILSMMRLQKKIKEKIPLLSKLIFIGIFNWAIYCILDIFIFNFAHLSFDINEDITASGYDINYPSLFIANILREFALTSLYLFVFSFYFAHLIIIDGTNITMEKMKNPLYIALIALIIVISCILENIYVIIESQHIIVQNIAPDLVLYFMFLLPTILFSITFTRLLIIIYKEEKTNKKGSKYLQKHKLLRHNKGDLNPADPNSRGELKNREINDDLKDKGLKKFTMGIFFLGTGFNWYVFWIILNSIIDSLDLLNNYALFTLISIFLHTFWLIGVVILYLAFQIFEKCQKIDSEFCVFV